MVLLVLLGGLRVAGYIDDKTLEAIKPILEALGFYGLYDRIARNQ